jgi:STE24 endopeptidase
MTAPLFITLLAVAFVLEQVISLVLLRRHSQHVAANREQVPAAFAESVPLAEHQKAADYTGAKIKLGLWELPVGLAFSVFLLFAGGLHWFWQLTAPLAAYPISREVAYMALLSAVGSVLSLPFAYAMSFGVEAKFGFNRMTRQLFWLDLIKNTLLSAALLLPILYAVFYLMRSAGNNWWWLAWACFFGFQLLMLALYPRFIAPLFNTFKPLDEGEAKTTIEGLLKRTGFESNGLFVMDGSKRSAHGNAYFTGFGKTKRIVFFDTLLEKLTPPEIEAVLAHELGHFKHKHVLKRIVMIGVMSLAFFGGVHLLLQAEWFGQAFGFAGKLEATPGLALILLAMSLPHLLFWIGPLSAHFSRKDEFEADAFAAATANKNDLRTALVKLTTDNAGTLTPDPAYAAYHYSHPPTPVRLAALARLA